MGVLPQEVFTCAFQSSTSVGSISEFNGPISPSMLPSRLQDSLSEHAMIAGGAIGLGPSLLVVDSDREMRRTLVSYFEQRGFHVAAAASLVTAKQSFATNKTWALVIADYHLPEPKSLDEAAWLVDWNGKLLKTVTTPSRNDRRLRRNRTVAPGSLSGEEVDRVDCCRASSVDVPFAEPHIAAIAPSGRHIGL